MLRCGLYVVRVPARHLQTPAPGGQTTGQDWLAPPGAALCENATAGQECSCEGGTMQEGGDFVHETGRVKNPDSRYRVHAWTKKKKKGSPAPGRNVEQATDLCIVPRDDLSSLLLTSRYGAADD